MRVSKEPEIRKQEILDAAIKVFVEKGYDKTSISDIANSMNISQGLCYRYFKSKEEIYDAAIDSYGNFLMNRMLEKIDYKSKSLREQIDSMSTRIENYEQVERERPELYELFHKAKNTPIHDRLYLRMSESLIPFITEILQKAIDSKETKITNAEAAARFCIYGQIGILRRTDISDEEKALQIKNTIKEFLGLDWLRELSEINTS